MGTEGECKSHQALAVYCPCFFMAINLLCASNSLCPQKEQLLRPPSSSQGLLGLLLITRSQECHKEWELGPTAR